MKQHEKVTDVQTLATFLTNCDLWCMDIPSPLKEIINSVALVTFILWIYSVGVNGQGRIIELGLHPMNIKLFKTNVIIVGVLGILGLIYSATQGKVNSVSKTFEFKDVIFMIVTLYLVFALFQTIIFASKTIAKIELRREVSFGDYVTNFLLLLFFFVGVWILQPKVNRLISREEEVAY